MPPINEFHKLLLARREELLADLASREEIQIPGRAADPLDEALASSNRVTAVDRVNRQTNLLRRVNRAIDKVIHGDYGTCDECDQEIPECRLLVVPWAECCVVCQERIER